MPVHLASSGAMAVPQAMSIDPLDKQLATFRAQLAFHGWTMQVVDSGQGAETFMVGRLGQSTTLPDRRAVLQFVRQISGGP